MYWLLIMLTGSLLCCLQHLQLDCSILLVFGVRCVHVRNGSPLPCTSQVLAACVW